MKTPAGSYNIFIHTPHSVCHVKYIPMDVSIAELKAKIELRTGIPREYQLLQLTTKPLYDEQRVGDTDIKNSSVIRLLFSTKASERLFAAANDGDFQELLRTGVQKIEIIEGPSVKEQARLMKWNKNVSQRAFIAVFVACFNGDIQLLSKLIKFSAFETNQVTSCGRSALHIAASRGSIGCVCLLLDHGIDPFIEDIDGKTAQDIAQDFDHIHCKRRIWLYRWSIKPTSTTKRQAGEKTKDPVQFPSLDASKSTAASRISDDQQLNEQEDTILPRVLSRTRVEHGTKNRSQESSLCDISPERNSSYIPNEANDKSTQPIKGAPKIVADIDGPAERQKNIEEGNEELAMLVNLARKYGYKIVQDGNELSSKSDCFDENVKESNLECETSREDRPGLDTSYSENKEKLDEDANHRTKNNVEPQRQTNSSVLKRRLSLVSKPSEKRELFKVKIAGMYENTERDLPASARYLTGNTPQLTECRTDGKAGHTTEGESAVSDTPKDIESKKNLQETNRTVIGNMEAGNEPDKQLGSIVINTDSKGDTESASPTFQNWLKRKEQQKRESLKQNTISPNWKEKRQSLSDQAFKKWLQSKRVRFRIGSISPQISLKEERLEKQRPKSGLSFESWVKMKGKIKPYLFSFSEEKTPNSSTKKVYSSGMSHSEWIESKAKEIKGSSPTKDSHIQQTKSKIKITGISFDKWVDSKTRQSQIDRVQKENEEMQAEYERDIEKKTKMKSQGVKTFEEWQLEKKYEDRIRKAKDKREARRAFKKRVKFEEDSKLVYNMWLLNKHLNEVEEEEEKLTSLRKEWERKRKMDEAKSRIRWEKANSL